MLITLPLYILRELGKALAVSFFTFAFILLAFVAGTVIQDGAGLFTVLSIMPRLFPLVSPLVLPMTIITGTLICYGRIAGNNELVATQASGVHPLWLASPALAVAVLAATITVYLNADILTVATASIEKALVKDRTDIVRRQLSKPGSFTFGNYAICRLREGGIDITFFDTPGRSAPDSTFPRQVRRIIAQDHSIGLEERENGDLFVKAKLRNFQQFDLGKPEMQPLYAAQAELSLPAAAEGAKFKISQNRLSYWGIGQLLAGRRELREQIAKAQAQATGVDDDALRQRWQRYAGDLQKSYDKQAAELHMKLTLSFSCLAFAVIGVPLGLLAKNTSRTAGYAYGTGVALLFYLLVKALQTQAREGRLDCWWMWLPNLVLLGLGAWLWHRCQRRD